MTDTIAATRTLVVEREMPHPPEKIWRALTQAPLIEEWLMKNDFQPVVGHRFNFRATPMQGWNGVTDCEVLEVIPHARLTYSWNASGDQAPDGLTTIVTWTLTPRERAERMCAWSSPASARRMKPAIGGWAAAGRAFWEGWRTSPPDRSDPA
jgi:uncharacterized protein YndB with AHSA1/START domain